MPVPTRMAAIVAKIAGSDRVTPQRKCSTKRVSASERLRPAHADEQDDERPAHHEAEDVARARAERPANPELAVAIRDAMRGDAVDADDADPEGDRGEDGEERRDEAGALKLRLRVRVYRAHPHHRDAGIDPVAARRGPRPPAPSGRRWRG